MQTITLIINAVLVIALLYVIFLFHKSYKQGIYLEHAVKKCNIELNRTLAKLDILNNLDKMEAKQELIKNPVLEIPGVNSTLALELLGGDLEIYLSVLDSYAYNTPEVIDKLRIVTVQTLPNYAIHMHGLKSSSGSIGAEDIQNRAAILEGMAKAGDLSGVLEQNGKFLEDAESLVNAIQACLNGDEGK